MSTQIILLERVDNLGAMGEIVDVKPGYARNYLLPQGKALRATKSNVAYFEAQKKALEAKNDETRKDAEKLAKKLDGTKVALIRQASESGQLYGSVNARDIAEAVTETGFTVTRAQIVMTQNFKTIGLFQVPVQLHPEVKAFVTLNIARSSEEATIQEETGKALVNTEEETDSPVSEAQEDTRKDMLEDTALQAEKEREAESVRLAAEEEEKARLKAEKRAAAKAAAEAEAPAEATEEKSAE